MRSLPRRLRALALLLGLQGVAQAGDEGLPPERVESIAAARALPPTLLPAQLAALKGVRQALVDGKRDVAQAAWKGFSEGYFTRRTAADLPTVADWLLREGFFEPDRALAPLARKVAFQVERRAAVTRHLADLRPRLRTVEGAGATTSVPGLVLADRIDEGRPAAAATAATLMTKAMLESEIKRWEEKLNALGDDAQLANVDLQNILQKQQQTLQMMSNISKMLYDTAQSVIRKMGG